jgi:hypothetical protein
MTKIGCLISSQLVKSFKVELNFFLILIVDDAPRIIEDEVEMRKKRIEKKRQLKMKFDTDYDEDETGGKAHYEELKKEVDQQAMVTQFAEFIL